MIRFVCVGDKMKVYEVLTACYHDENPRANMPDTPNFCFIGICSLMTIEIGRLMTAMVLERLSRIIAG